MSEEKFEKAVIEKLKKEGWTYREDLSNKKAEVLEQNWREVLNDNNRIKLKDKPLSDNEFDKLKQELTHNKTPYDAQLLLAGAGGVGTLPLKRDDGSQLEIEIFYGDEVAGGHSRYEIVNQITFDKLPRTLGHNRRIDIMLLINGLPVGHVEEKDETRANQLSAFEQFQKYDSDGMYEGLFSFVQVMFVLSQHSAHYFARPKNSTEYNREFLFGWRDDDGNDISDAMVFIHQVMGIPALHRLVTVNMIPDADNDNLMVMRSYQIQATRAIMDRMRVMENNHLVEKEGGYVWHTTGSGKTVTSFKVAQLLASLPRVRHVLFIVDRVDLVNQTAENFKSFAYKTFEKRIQVVKGYELKKLFKQKGPSNIFLTTVQGLDKAVKTDLKSDERMVILMDEAHRSSSGDAVANIKSAFPKTTWFAFTGTPNFYSDDANDVKTTRAVSTYDVFGQRLHRYTIKDAISDQNVLGFDVSYYTPTIEKDADSDLTEKELEKAVYTSYPFREAVVEDIRDHWDENHSGPIEMGVREPNQFHGMLAVSGKQAVVAYYNLFKKLAPNLRVAMTYSRDEDNGMGSSDLQESLKTAIKDYSTFYGTHDFFNDSDQERAYLTDITKRIAHKKPYNRKLTAEQEAETPQRLDLIIVSDQLLTGFDSKYVNTIYMDKILKEGLLIQAMSRTNRTIDRNAKPHGKVRFFRKGEMMENRVKQALVIYTQGGNDTQPDKDKLNKDTDDMEKELTNDDILAPKMAKQIQKLIPQIDELKTMAGEDFSITPRSEKKREQFVQLAADVNHSVQRLVQQGYNIGAEIDDVDANGNQNGNKIALNLEDKEQFGALQARLNEVNGTLPPKMQIDLTNIQIAIDLYSREIIDYDRLVELINEYMKETVDTKRAEIEKHIAALSDSERNEIIEILDGIVSGKYRIAFNTETLDQTRKTVRSDHQELMIRRWADDHHLSGNAIIEAYEDFLPGVGLNDNPKLKARLEQIENDEKLGFFQIADFEDGVQDFFAKL